MRRLAPALVAVAVLAAGSARAEPLDLDLSKLGAPDPTVWTSLAELGGATLTPTEAAQAAKEARQRFAVLTTELALAFSSAILQPASTTGHSGFALDLELGYVGVDSKAIGAPTPALGTLGTGGFSNQTWPTRDTHPTSLLLASAHARKALPWSLELGGRMLYLTASSYWAAQGELKWALNEGFWMWPDVAVRAAYTKVFGVKDLSLGTTDLDFMISKRFGVQGVTSLTPYAAARLTWVSASSERIQFAGGRMGETPPVIDPVDLTNTTAAFPRFSTMLYRTTLGLRFTAYAVSLGLEGTYFAGATKSTKSYEGVKLASSFGGAAKLGWEF